MVKSDIRLSVVIPTRNSSSHIARTLQTVVAKLTYVSWLQIVVVDDASTDETARITKQTLENLPEVSYTIIELAKNLGQSSATAVGLSNSLGDIVVTLDDDLSHPPNEISKLVEALSQDLDFVVGAPSTYPNSRPRQLASQIIRWLGVRAFGTPKDFRFSSFIAYHQDFLLRIDLPSCRVDEIGWMFLYTQRFSNTTFEAAVGVRSESNYGIRRLLNTAKPLASPIIKLLSRLMRRLSLLLALGAAILATTYVLRSTFGEGLLPGFPTVVLILFMNLSLAGIVLSISISILTELRSQRRANIFHTQRRIMKYP